MDEWEVVSPQKSVDGDEWEVVQEPKRTKEDEILERYKHLQAEHPLLHKISEYIVKNQPKTAETINFLGESYRPFNEAVEESGLPEFSGNLLQELGNTGISIANTPASLASLATGKDLSEYKAPHLNFEKYFGETPGLAGYAGKGASLVAPGAFISKAVKFARPKGYTGVLSDILKGAGIGYATGENEEGDRTLGTILGGLFGSAGNLTRKGVGKRITEDARKTQEKLGKEYENIFKEAEKSWVDKVKSPRMNTESLKRYNPKDKLDSLYKFEHNPTLKNSHDAQSDLGKIIRKYKKAYESPNGQLSSGQIKAWEQAVEAQKKIRGSMYQEFVRNGRPDLAKKYAETTQKYAEEYIPYTTKESKALVKKLMGNPKHEEFLGKNYPELGLKEKGGKLINALKYPVGIGIGGVGAHYGAKKALEYIMGEE